MSSTEPRDSVKEAAALVFFPWSVPFWIAAIVVGTWLGGSALGRILRR